MAFDAGKLLGAALSNVVVRVDTAAGGFTLDGLARSGPSKPSPLLTWLRPAVTISAPDGTQLYRVAPYGDPPPPPNPVGLILLVAGAGALLVLGGVLLAAR